MSNFCTHRVCTHKGGNVSISSRRRKHLVLLLLMGLIFLSYAGLAAASAKIQATEPLRGLAQEFLQQQLDASNIQDSEIRVSQLDPRLRLAMCEEKPAAFLPAGAKLRGRITVGIRCHGQKPWTVYIPANIRVFQQVVTATRPITRGVKLSERDVTRIRKEVSGLRAGYYTKPAQVIGKITKKSVVEGEVFSTRGLKAPMLVRNGEQVTIIASVGSLRVRTKGTALKDAAMGERITVKNLTSKRLVEAVVISRGTVGVNM